MARQPVVLETPPDKQVVVLRQGKAAKAWGTWISAALGAILLLGAVILVGVLPDDASPPLQYQISFDESRVEIGGEIITLSEGQTATFAIPYEGTSLFAIAISLQWQDDLAASLPDTFEASLSSPNGTVVFGPKTMQNAQPTAGADAGTYVAKSEQRVLSFTLYPRPTTEILSAEYEGEPLASIQARAKQFEGDLAGEWALELTLQTAGDCPEPQSLDSMRAIACRGEAPDGIDSSNDIQILGVEFVEYHTTVTPL